MQTVFLYRGETWRDMEGGGTVVSGVVTGVETPVSRVKSVTLKLHLYFHLYRVRGVECRLAFIVYVC